MKTVEVGDRFSRLTVVSPVYRVPQGKSSVRVVDCLCDCGTQKQAASVHHLLDRGIKSCGCIRSASQTTHGDSGQPLHNVWMSMRARCRNSSGKDAHLYHYKGIRVCREWEDYSTFKAWALANGYDQGLLIDRKDGNLGYCPDNCRWVTPTISSRNTSRNTSVTAFDETKPICEWAEDPRCTVEYMTLFNRLHREGWEPELAITAPAGSQPRRCEQVATAFDETKPLRDWAEDPRCVVEYSTLFARIVTNDWDAERAITTPARQQSTTNMAAGRKSRVFVEAFEERKLISAWAKDPRCVVSLTALYNRIEKLGMEPEAAITTKATPGIKAK